ncbi:MAG: DUF4270 family protein [Tenacibaculum sp.]
MKKRFVLIGSYLLSVILLISSCEKDFNDIGGSLITNTKFRTNVVDLELKIESIPVNSVRADNIEINIPEYWLGVYRSQHYKTLKASFVSQIGFLTNLKTSDSKAASEVGEIDSIYSLDKVVLVLPYTASIKTDTDGSSFFKLDSVLGNPSIGTSLKIYRNGTFLNRLDPSNPSEVNKFESNREFIQLELLNENDNFSFIPSAADTVYNVVRRRITDINTGASDTFNSSEKLSNDAPFLAVPLNIEIMKNLFWDKFNSVKFSSADQFNTYFRGIIAKVQGDDGSAVPLSLSSSANDPAALEFYYTITRYEIDSESETLIYKDTVPSKYSFPLSGVKSGMYKTLEAEIPVPPNNFTLQGTTGTLAQISILGVNLSKLKQNDPDNLLLKYQNRDNDPKDNYLSLKELATIRDTENQEYGLLINEASLSFYVNQSINTEKDVLPQRLFAHIVQKNDDDTSSPIHLEDAYNEIIAFDGNLVSTDNNPEKYTIRITNYISNLLNGSSTNFSPLTVKVYNNPTDNPVINNVLNTRILPYNWNPRGVTLFDESDDNGEKKAVLKITYSEKR